MAEGCRIAVTLTLHRTTEKHALDPLIEHNLFNVNLAHHERKEGT